MDWTRWVKADQPERDITELLVMIRRRSGGINALEASKQADAKGLPERPKAHKAGNLV